MKLVVCELSDQAPKILHAVEVPSGGLRHGYVVDFDKAVSALATLITKAEREYKQRITKVRLSIGGIGLASQYVRTSIDVTSRTNELTDKNVDEVLEKAENLFTAKYPNKKILHVVPVKYRVDGKDVLGTPSGMYGTSLEAKVVFITVLEHHYDALVNLVEGQGLTVNEAIAAPIADAATATTYKQQTQGCLITNVGAETTTLSTFENGIITSLDVVSIGSNDVTNDIALGLQVPLEEAEAIKRGTNSNHPKRRVEEIIGARCADVVELAENHLFKIKKNRLLPAGVAFTGGGSSMDGLEDLARHQLKLPAATVSMSRPSRKSKRTVTVPNQFSVAYGLCISDHGNRRFSQGGISMRRIRQSIAYWFNQLMP